MTVAEAYQETERAERRIRALIRETYLERSPVLSDRTGVEVFLKLENLQITGSFKFRGALSKVLSLSADDAERGVVTASTGNHGLAVAAALRMTGRNGIIYLPRSAAPHKVAALQSAGASFEFHGDDCGEAEQLARQEAERSGRVFVSPYNDPQVIGGQGTLGVELHRQCPAFDAVLVSVGGGGLISGVAAYLKKVRPGVRVIGCLPENSPAMYECVRAGGIVETKCYQTLSDGTAGSVEPGAITFELCRSLVDDWVLVSEEEILSAMRLVLEHHHLVVEGAAGVAVAALLKSPGRFQGKTVTVVLCGGNVGTEVLQRVLSCPGKDDHHGKVPAR